MPIFTSQLQILWYLFEGVYLDGKVYIFDKCPEFIVSDGESLELIQSLVYKLRLDTLRWSLSIYIKCRIHTIKFRNQNQN